MSIVYLLKTRTVKPLRQILETIEKETISQPILLKPNIVCPAKAKRGIVTEPLLVKEVIRYFKERGAHHFIIAESPGLGVKAKETFAISGYTTLAKEEGADLLDLNTAPTKTLNWEFGEIEIPQIVLESYYINLAKLKTHINTMVSLSLKNQKGLLKSSEKKHFHQLGLHAPIASLAQLVKPQLTIIDGLVGLQGDGPLFSGKKINSQLIVVSKDMVAADAVACRVMGIEPIKVKHLWLSYQKGVGDINPQIEGNEIERIKQNFLKPKEDCFQFGRFKNWRNPYSCTMCGISLRAALEMIIKSPLLWSSCLPKLIDGIWGKGIDFISGLEAKIPPTKGQIYCLGDCTKEIAQRHHLIYVEGCPPAPSKIVEALR
ncbi:MAG: DUF362 domain-containing protein [Candidatus Edwardsbacteria bacterium]